MLLSKFKLQLRLLLLLPKLILNERETLVMIQRDKIAILVLLSNFFKSRFLIGTIVHEELEYKCRRTCCTEI